MADWRSVARPAMWLSSRAVSSLGVAAVVGGALALPTPSMARAAGLERYAALEGSTHPAERALTGGIVTLRAPASLMVRIPSLSYQRGSSALDVIEALLLCSREPYGELCDQGMFADEVPQHPVRVSSFWLDRTEVTVAAYQRCVELRQCSPVEGVGAERFEQPNLPRGMVSYQDAKDYCRFRGARLPTEAEWEGAAKGTVGRKFPWGNYYNSRASNHGRLGWNETDDRDGYAELAPVGSFPAGGTPQGVLDLAGNVAEWVEDEYGPYPDGPQHNPRGTGTSGARIARGGHYQSPAPWLRSASRMSADPDVRRPYIGFRCAKSARKLSGARPAAPGSPAPIRPRSRSSASADGRSTR